MVVHLHVVALMRVAGQPLEGAHRFAHGAAVAARNHVAVTLQCAPVERLYLVRRVGSQVARRLHPQVKAAEVQIHVGRAIVLVLFLFRLRPRIRRQANVRQHRRVVGLHLQAAERGLDLYVVAIAVLVLIHMAARQGQQPRQLKFGGRAEMSSQAALGYPQRRGHAACRRPIPFRPHRHLPCLPQNREIPSVSNTIRARRANGSIRTAHRGGSLRFQCYP